MASKETVGGNELNLVAAGTVFEGKIRTPGSIRIDGRVMGDVMASQNVSIGATGDVNGNISAKNVTIGGKSTGSIVAQEKLVFESSAAVRGEIRAAKLVVNEGALYDGQCVMSDAKPMPTIVEPPQEPRKPETR
jgi:cytoskeletal protein CcmA (bactofilin family)